MAITQSGTSITFNDATVQTTAFTGGYTAGLGAQVFAANGTFTIPTGVTALKVTIVGGGGAGSNIYGNGGSGGSGGAGGSSSISSGTQTITTVTAGGGGGAVGGYQSVPSSGAGGTATNATLSWSGNWLGNTSASGLAWGYGPPAPGSSAVGYGGGGNYGSGESWCGDGASGGGGALGIVYLTGLTSGATITVVVGAGGTKAGGGSAGNGSAGRVIFEW